MVVKKGLTLADPNLLKQANYINGKWTHANNPATLTVRNPATGEPVGDVPAMGADENRHAIEAARRAFPQWSALLASDVKGGVKIDHWAAGK